MSILVIDIGTSGLRAAVVRPDATLRSNSTASCSPSSPEAGLVEFDPDGMVTAALEVARAVLAEGGPVDAVGITNQRASTILWDRATGRRAGAGDRMAGPAHRRNLPRAAGGRHPRGPNASATKAAWLLDAADPDRTRDLCIGTVDAWLAWHLSEGAVHVSDATNAGVTALMKGDGSDWDDKMLDALRIPRGVAPHGRRQLRRHRSGHRARGRTTDRGPGG